MAITERSRYNRSTEIQVTDVLGVPTRRPYLDIWPRFLIRSFFDDREIAVEQGDNWSHLGFKLYGDGRDWWVIAEVNKVVDPWRALNRFKKEGGILRAPSVSRLNFDILDFASEKV